jgi:hypothetical protein
MLGHPPLPSKCISARRDDPTGGRLQEVLSQRVLLTCDQRAAPGVTRSYAERGNTEDPERFAPRAARSI